MVLESSGRLPSIYQQVNNMSNMNKLINMSNMNNTCSNLLNLLMFFTWKEMSNCLSNAFRRGVNKSCAFRTHAREGGVR